MALDARIPLQAYNAGDLTAMRDDSALKKQRIEEGKIGMDVAKLQAAKAQNDAVIQRLSVTNDQASWDQGLQWAEANGIDTRGLPRQFDPTVKQQLMFSSLSVADQLNMQLKQMEMGYKSEERQYERMKDDRQYGLDVYKAQRDGGLFLDDGSPLGTPGFVPGQPVGTSSYDLRPDTFAGGTTLSVRNNNPGNMRPVGQSSGFQKFDTPEAGMEAMKRDLLGKVQGTSPIMKERYGEGYTPTLTNLISTWAPSSENDTGNYIQTVARETGIDPNAPLSPMDIERIAPAMVKMEGGQQAADYYGTATTPSQGQSATVNSAMEVPGNPVKSGKDFVRPLFTNKGLPVTDGLGEGQQWAVDTRTGQRTAMDIPGYISDEQKKLKSTLPAAIESSQQALGLIDSLIGSADGSIPPNPSLSQAVGTKLLSPDYAFGIKSEPFDGSGSADVNAIIEQLQGKNFLEAFQALKGGGAITQIEGEKAQNAIARLSTKQSDKAFEASLKELRGIIQKGIDRNNQKLGGQPQETQATGEIKFLGFE